MSHALNFLYSLALSFWIGGATLFTFILTPRLFNACSRDMAGNIVGLLFPGYFRWGLVCGVVALLCKLIGRGRFSMATVILLLAMLLLTATQAFVIEPKAATIKQHIASFDTTPKDDPHRVQFRQLHGLSMAANLAVITCGVLLILLGSLPNKPSPGTMEVDRPSQQSMQQKI